MNISLLMFKTIIILALTFHISAWAAADKEPDLSISIGVPIHLDNRTIDLRSSSAHFHVLISNTSQLDFNLWREWCSWGYFNLSFEIIDANGKLWSIKKREKVWAKNFPDFVTLAPNQSFVLDIDFDPGVWKGIPLSNKTTSQKVSMRAIYKNDESGMSKKHNVWSGSITSPLQEYTINY